MGSEKSRQTVNHQTFRRTLRMLRNNSGGNEPIEVNLVKEHLLEFVEKLQGRYPFKFAIAYRDLKSEVNKQAQERLTTHCLIGAISELSALDPKLKENAWELAALLSHQIGKGGEHFHPLEFSEQEKALAEEIGEANVDLLLGAAEKLSLAIRFKMVPVNTSEHVISWSFRYVKQLLKAAKWESIQR